MDMTTKADPVISLRHLLKRFKGRITVTFSLALLESVLDIFYPLLIGIAVNDLLEQSYQGLIYLAGLGLLSLLIGSARRFYDTRAYSDIYCHIAPETVARERQKNAPVSSTSARVSLLNEIVEFLENSMPEILGATVSLAGVLIIMMQLNLNIFFACLLLMLLIAATYTLTGRYNFRLNAGYNDELERQVDTLQRGSDNAVRQHCKRLMRWNIRLSDLETIHYFLIWLGAIALFIYTPLAAVQQQGINYGLVIALVMYVFDYIDKVVTFPVFIQQAIRLKEITQRLNTL